jgi:lipopolysaccharide export system permease protein
VRLSFIFSRYLVFSFLRWLGVVFLVVSAIILLFDCAELLRKSASHPQIHFKLILEMMVLKFPSLIETVFPFIILFASMLTFWNLNKHHELEVARAAGISVWQILLPLLFTSFLIGGFDLVFVNPVSARMMLRYEHLNNFYFGNQTDSLSISESGIWVREAQKTSQMIFHVHRINQKDAKLYQIKIFESDPDDRFTKRIDAKEGYFENKQLHLFDVWVSRPDLAPEYFNTHTIESNLTFKSLKNAGADPASIPFWKLLTFSEILEKSGISGLKYTLYWHSLLARWVWLGVMILLAATCTLRPLRQKGVAKLVFIGLSSAFLLYFFRDIAHALGSSSSIPVMLAAWIPPGVSILISTTFLLHQEDG